MVPESTLAEAKAVLEACRAAGVRVATAESCTGGLIMATLTAIAGASDVVDRGFVTYSNDAKQRMTGVPAALIEAHGAISDEVARAMADGALANSAAEIAVSATGVAGPGGGSSAKPVGLVCFGLARKGRPTVTNQRTFSGDRTAIRAAAVLHALTLIRSALQT